MSDSSVWSVDRVAAVNLCRALGVDPGEEQIGVATRHLAEHRASAFDLAVSRMRAGIESRIHRLMMDHSHHRDAHWSEGCLSAEQAIITMSSSDLVEADVPRAISKGQALRMMLRSARQQRPHN